MALDGELDHGPVGIEVRHVGGDEAAIAQLGGDPLTRLHVEVGDDHGGAGLVQRLGRRASKPARATGHQGHPSLHVHSALLVG